MKTLRVMLLAASCVVVAPAFAQTAGNTPNTGPQGSGNFVADQPEGTGTSFVAGKPEGGRASSKEPKKTKATWRLAKHVNRNNQRQSQRRPAAHSLRPSGGRSKVALGALLRLTKYGFLLGQQANQSRSLRFGDFWNSEHPTETLDVFLRDVNRHV
jgi:hypothetical protein